MKSKNDEGPEQAGRITSLSALAAVLETDAELAALQNLKLRLTSPGGEELEGDVYAKVIAVGEACKLRFTAVPPTVAAFIDDLVGSERSTDLVERD